MEQSRLATAGSRSSGTRLVVGSRRLVLDPSVLVCGRAAVGAMLVLAVVGVLVLRWKADICGRH